MKYTVDFNNSSINGIVFDSKGFNNSLCMIVLGKPVYKQNPDFTFAKSKHGYKIVDRYILAKNIDAVDFCVKKVNNRPTLQRKELAYMAMSLSSAIPTLLNGKPFEWFDYSQCLFEITEYMQSKESQELLNQNIKMIMKDKVLSSWYAKHGVEGLNTYLDGFISESGYDVELSSSKITEGLVVYNFYDGYQRIEGCKPNPKQYEKYERQLNDKLKLYESIKVYKEFGLEPELTKQKHDDIGRKLTAMGVDEDFLEDAIEKELHQFDISFDEPIVTPISACGLGTQMLFN